MGDARCHGGSSSGAQLTGCAPDNPAARGPRQMCPAMLVAKVAMPCWYFRLRRQAYDATRTGPTPRPFRSLRSSVTPPPRSAADRGDEAFAS